MQVLTDFFGKKKTDLIETKDVEKFVVWRSGQNSRKTKDKITRGTVNRELITLVKVRKMIAQTQAKGAEMFKSLLKKDN